MYENEIYSNSDTGTSTGSNQYTTYQTTGSSFGPGQAGAGNQAQGYMADRKSTRLNSSHM